MSTVNKKIRYTTIILLLILITKILSNFIYIEFFNNNQYKGISIEIPFQLYNIIGNNKPIEDIKLYNDTYICIECN